MANAFKANIFLQQAKDHKRAEDHGGEFAYLGLAENHLRLALSDCDSRDDLEKCSELLEQTTNRKLVLMSLFDANVSINDEVPGCIPDKCSSEKPPTERNQSESQDSEEEVDSSEQSDGSDCSQQRKNKKGKQRKSKKGKKKSEDCPFTMTKPTDVDDVVGQDEAKVILLANICGPIKYPKHFEKMNKNAKLKAFCLYGPPGNSFFLFSFHVLMRLNGT